MKQYHDLLNRVLTEGDWKDNRTGIKTISISGAHMQFDLREGFPALTTKKLAWNSVVAELKGFLEGADNAARFREFGTHIWDANANQNKAWLENPNRKGEDDLGRIYGVQWRDWQGHGRSIDQLATCINTIATDPDNRRIIMSAWNPDDLDKMALPPCHVLYQFIANKETKMLDMCMYQRSADMFLGVPFNIASASLLLSYIADVTDYTPRYFNHFLADAHIYENHMDAVAELLTREPYPLPSLHLGLTPELDQEFDDWYPELLDYQFHPTIKADMAV